MIKIKIMVDMPYIYDCFRDELEMRLPKNKLVTIRKIIEDAIYSREEKPGE